MSAAFAIVFLTIVSTGLLIGGIFLLCMCCKKFVRSKHCKTEAIGNIVAIPVFVFSILSVIFCPLCFGLLIGGQVGSKCFSSGWTSSTSTAPLDCPPPHSTRIGRDGPSGRYVYRVTSTREVKAAEKGLWVGGITGFLCSLGCSLLFCTDGSPGREAIGEIFDDLDDLWRRNYRERLYSDNVWRK